MSKKKIAIFIHALKQGGAQKIASVLINELQSNYDLHLVLFKPGEIAYQIPETTKIYYLGNSGSPLGFVKNIFAFKRFCREHQIEVALSLITQPNYIGILSKWIGNRTKIIVSEHTYQSLWRANERIYPILKKRIINLLYNRADGIVTVSKKIREDLNKNFAVKEQLLKVIYNPYDIDQIQQRAEEEVTDYSFEGKQTIVTVGTMYHVKNQELLIRAFAGLKRKDTQLLLVGDGELRHSLEALAMSLGVEDRVTVLGFTSNPFKYVSKSDVFVLSSNNEGLPNVIIEALAAGCPVVSTDCISGPREILAPGTSLEHQLENEIEYAPYGILVPIKNEAIMTQALTEILEQEDLREKYRSKTLSRAMDFKAEISLASYAELIENI